MIKELGRKVTKEGDEDGKEEEANPEDEEAAEPIGNDLEEDRA